MKKNLRWVSLVLVCLYFLTLNAFAQEAISPQSSLYILGSSAEITTKSNGNLTISFWVSGTGAMTEIGATSIDLYENNGSSTKLIKTYRSSSSAYSHIMGANKGVHSSSVTYSGTVGYKYYAEVHLKVGNSSGSDSIVETSPTVTARK